MRQALLEVGEKHFCFIFKIFAFQGVHFHLFFDSIFNFIFFYLLPTSANLGPAINHYVMVYSAIVP